MSARSRLLSPSAWPIAVKLALVLLASSLAPMGVTAALEIRQARAGAEEAELTSLAALAQSTAGRLDQLFDDTLRVVGQIAGEAEVAAFLAAGRDAPAGVRASVERTIANVLRANDDIAEGYLLDARGTCVLSSNAADLGRDYAFREYYREAIHGQGYISEILVGSTTHRPGVYFTRGVAGGDGGIVGVAVIKLSGEIIARMVASVRPATGGAFLVDGWGVIVSGAEPGALYRSLAPLSSAVERLPSFEQRFSAVGVDHIQSLGLDALGQRLAGASASGSAAFATPALGGGARQIAGFAPLSAKRWALVVHRPQADLAAPLARATRRTVANAVLVGALMILVALVLARNIVRPVRRLIGAARAIQRGDFRAARIEVPSEDEIGALAGAFDTMARGLEERERELAIFGRMVSPEVREKLLAGHLELGGETRRAVVLFSDIRGFSSLSEKMDPQAVVALLNEYLTAMVEATAAYNGYVNNFIGDAIVVIFGAPIPQTDAERRAVSAALAMRAALAELNLRRAARGEVPLATGIGIAVGDMVAGQIGSPARMVYTVIGDAVNVAARLEALTKDYPGKTILITRRVADALGAAPEVGALEPLGPHTLKGRLEPVEVFAVGVGREGG